MIEFVIIESDDQYYLDEIVDWCRKTFNGSSGSWDIYHGYPKKYKLVLRPKNSETEMFIRLKWL